MSKKAFRLIAIFVLLGLLLSACTMSASNPPAPATATSEADFPFPVQTDQAQPAEGSTETADSEPKEAIEMTPQAGGGVLETPAGEDDQAGGGVPAQTAEEPQGEQAAQEEDNGDDGEPVALPTVTRPATYTLLRGEWPFCIARRFNLPVGQLLSLNGLTVDSKPAAGTVLTIPQSGSWDSGARQLKPHPTTYTVKSGDSVNSIACYFGDVDPSGIIALNNLEPPYSLDTGQTLQIP